MRQWLQVIFLYSKDAIYYVFLKMKSEKVFFRYKNFEEAPAYTKERTEKRPYDKKKYTEKHNRTKQPFKTILDSFIPITDLPPRITELLTAYPKFFNRQGKPPEKDSNEILNEYLIFNTKKFLENLKDPKKEAGMLSSSGPDWNSDEEIDCDMESKKIDQAVIQNVAEKLKDKPVKKQQLLKPHQKRFLQDYFRSKRQQQQEQDSPIPPKAEQKQTKVEMPSQSKSQQSILIKKPKENELMLSQNGKQAQKPKLVWSEYQQRQVNTFVDMGFMTKIDENEQEIPMEVIEDDGMFNEEEVKVQHHFAKSQSSSQSQEEDDIFGDQHTTTIKTKHEIVQPKAESNKKIQGTVMINDHVFSNIAEAVGLLPARCNWIIKNDITKYKVTTDYMDAYYRKEMMFEILPLISLNHSQFVNNNKVQTSEGIQLLRDYNYRRNQIHYQPRPKYQYKQKQFTHLKKK